tara:strand:- start:1084 stop:1281 length:198 start_codon:yes stop_codon:yes gene_type:complete
MKNLCVIFIIYFGLTSNAYAYLDPGTGSVILSAIIAGIVAIKTYWLSIINKIKKYLIRKNIIKNK